MQQIRFHTHTDDSVSAASAGRPQTQSERTKRQTGEKCQQCFLGSRYTFESSWMEKAASTQQRIVDREGKKQTNKQSLNTIGVVKRPSSTNNWPNAEWHVVLSADLPLAFLEPQGKRSLLCSHSVIISSSSLAEWQAFPPPTSLGFAFPLHWVLTCDTENANVSASDCLSTCPSRRPVRGVWLKSTGTCPPVHQCERPFGVVLFCRGKIIPHLARRVCEHVCVQVCVFTSLQPRGQKMHHSR